MSPAAGEIKTPSPDQIRAELEAVLSSGIFGRAPSLAQFLRYVCLKVLNGEADQIKEYSIAVEALGRPADFDQREDAIVRVEAHRLRKRLKQFYESEGSVHPLQIVIPPGKYVPQFVERNLELGASNGNGQSTALAPAGGPVVEILPPPRRTWRMPFLLGVGLVVAAAALLILLPRESESPAPPAPAGAVPRPPLALPDEDGIRIAAGSNTSRYVDSAGKTWVGDRWVLGGEVSTSPPAQILRTRDPVLFQSRREGDFRYRIPLEPGAYEVHLYFAERVFGEGNIAGGGETSRLFHIFANGVPLTPYLDIVADASGSNTADIKIFKDLRPGPDGFLHLHFSPFKEKAFVNGIVVLPGIPGKMRPIRIVAGNSTYRDNKGRLWSPDHYSLGGQVVNRTEPVTGTTDPGLFQTERFGNFSYALPVAEGSYSVTLYFAETWFGPTKPTPGGVGSRVFDVYCNGVTLLKNFDVYQAAGGGNRAVQRTFRNLRPNAQGKLMLSFVPVVNYASVNAVEVVAEDK
jgi:hypothetical protein